jgi:hypothetical protein
MTATDAVSQDGGVETPDRTAEFRREVARLKIKSPGGERRMLSLAIGFAVIGFVLIGVGWYQTSGISPSEGSAGVNKQINYLISCGLSGLGLIALGGALFVRYSLGQYMRYWIQRQVAEQQAQTDRIVAAVEASSPSRDRP